MKRRRLGLAVLFLVPAVAVGVACSFPDVTFGPDEADGSTPDVITATNEGSAPTDTGSSGSSGNPSNDAGPDADASADAGDGAVVLDTTDAAPIDASGCAVQPRCDCDNDGYKAHDCDAAVSELDANLLPNDCDDLNAARHPDAGFHDDPTTNGDWNCDTQIERFPPVGSTTCPSGTGPLGGLSCTAVSDFYITVPDCGASAALYTCSGTIAFGKCAAATSEGKNTVENCQ